MPERQYRIVYLGLKEDGVYKIEIRGKRGDWYIKEVNVGKTIVNVRKNYGQCRKSVERVDLRRNLSLLHKGRGSNGVLF